MTLVDCTHDRHAGAILAIFNDAILTSTALYDYQARTQASMQSWFAAKRQGEFPVIGFEDDDGTLMGFASYGTFRAYPAFKYTVEHSVYVDKRFRGRGLGEALLRAVVERATTQQYHVLVGAIDSTNATSCALHEKLGFTRAGTINQAGFKFGKWLDLVFYQLQLPTPAQPVDG
jgi:phosphinothricin acetyltransferase